MALKSYTLMFPGINFNILTLTSLWAYVRKKLISQSWWYLWYWFLREIPLQFNMVIPVVLGEVYSTSLVSFTFDQKCLRHSLLFNLPRSHFEKGALQCYHRQIWFVRVVTDGMMCSCRRITCWRFQLCTASARAARTWWTATSRSAHSPMGAAPSQWLDSRAKWTMHARYVLVSFVVLVCNVRRRRIRLEWASGYPEGSWPTTHYLPLPAFNWFIRSVLAQAAINMFVFRVLNLTYLSIVDWHNFPR